MRPLPLALLPRTSLRTSRAFHSTPTLLFKQRKPDASETKPNPSNPNPDNPVLVGDDAIRIDPGAGEPQLGSTSAAQMASRAARESEAKSFVEAERNVERGKK